MVENAVFYYDTSIVVETYRGNIRHHAIWYITRKKADRLGYFNPYAAEALEYFPNEHFRRMGWELIG